MLERRDRSERPGGALRLLGTVLALCALSLTPARADDDDHDLCADEAYGDSYACREVIVERTADFDAADIERRYDLTVTGVIPQLGQIWFVAPTAVDVPTLKRDLKAEPGVVRVSRNAEFGSAECRQLNGAILELTGSWGGATRVQEAIAAMNATADDPSVGRGVTIAILDTGLDRAHPELALADIAPGIDLVAGGTLAADLANGVDDNANGQIDEGWGHGTAVAGLIHLVAPGARLMPVRVLDDECRGTAFDLTRGIVEAVDAGAHILNVSLGARDESSPVSKALRYAHQRGVIVVASGGNALASPDGENEVAFPAEDDDTVAVSAVDPWLVAPAWTVADDDIDLSAPGVDLLTIYRGGYARVSGTSFSAAFVSAAAAAALAAGPQLEREQVIELIEETAIPVDDFNARELRDSLGAGIPDFAALQARAAAGEPGLGRARFEHRGPTHAPDHPSTGRTSFQRHR